MWRTIHKMITKLFHYYWVLKPSCETILNLKKLKRKAYNLINILNFMIRQSFVEILTYAG